MRRIAFVVAGVVALLAVLVAAALLTTPGLRLALRLAQPLTAGVFDIERAEGRLAGPVVLYDVSWNAGGFRGTASRIELDWQLAALMRREVVVNYLEIAGVTAQQEPGERAPAEQPPQWPASIDLPVAIQVHRLDIRDISVAAGGAAAPWRIDAFSLRVTTEQQLLSVEDIELRGERLGATGIVRLQTGENYSASATLDWWLALPEVPRIAGRTDAQMSKGAVAIQQSLSEPTAASLDGNADFSNQDIDWQVSLAVPPFNLSAVKQDLPAMQIAGNLRASGSASGGELAGSIELPDYLPTALNLNGVLSLSDTRLDIERLTLALADRPEALEARGSVQLDTSRDAVSQLNVNWRNLRWPLEEEALATSPVGTLSISGTPAGFAFSTQAGIEGKSVPATQLAIAGNGNLQEIMVSKLRAQLLGGLVEGTARLKFEPDLMAQLDVTATALDPGTEYPGWNGNIGFSAKVDVATDSLAAQVNDLAGTLRGYPWRGSGEVKIHGDQLSVNRVVLVGEGTRLDLSGRAGDSLDLNWTLNAEELAVLHPQGAGALNSVGTLSGTRQRPVLNASVVGDKVAWSGYRVRSLMLDATVDVTDASASSIKLDAKGLATEGIDLDSLTVTALGQASDHVIDIDLRAAQGTLDTRLAGGWIDAAWRGQFTDLAVSPKNSAAWRLVEPAVLAVGLGDVLLESLCLASDDERGCLEGQWNPAAGVQANSSLTGFQIARLTPLIPGAPVLAGVLSADVALRGSDLATATGSLTARLSEASLEESLEEDKQPLIEGASGTLEMSLEAQRISSVGELQLGDKGSVNFTIDIPIDEASAAADLPVSGTLNAATRSLALLPLFTRDVDRVTGELRADLQLAGTVSAPLFTGDLNLLDARADMPQFGLSLSAINVVMTARERGLDVDGSFASGNGTAAFNGELDFAGGTPRGSLALSGERLTIVDLPQIRIDASPDVNVAIEGTALTFSGSVGVPSARVTPLEVSDAVRVSPDQVIVTAAEETNAQALQLQTTTEVELLLGDDVSIDAYGLTGDIEGRLAIYDSSDSITTATGELSIVDGKYEAWGQKLDVARGRLIFSGGEISNPAMDVSAQRKVDEYTVGVKIRGNLVNPELTVFSDPSLPSTEAFSYLLTGRSLRNASESDRQYLDNASNTLALRGGALLASQLGRQLGLDDVALEGADNRDETRFVIGTYLSPRLYVSFGLGLFEAVNALRIRYQINNKWSVAVESGDESSTDIEYVLER